MNSVNHKVSRLLAMIVVAAILSACSEGSNPDPSATAPLIKVLVQPVENRDVELFIDMVGTTLGTQDVPIRARAEGFLETMTFREGSFVKKGDPLYTIDAQPYLARLVEAQSLLAGAQTNLVRSQSDLARIKPLAEMKAVSEQDLDGAVAQEAAARASVRASEAGVDLAEIDLSYTQIFAPIDGLIGLTLAKPGEFVGREPNPVVLNTLSDVNPIRVRFSISEREYLIVARTYLAAHTGDSRRGIDTEPDQGNDLLLILADGTEHPDRGKVVASSQSINQDTGTYTLEASFPNSDMLLLPGQFARVRALYEVLKNVDIIPRTAVSEMQGLFRVYVVDENGMVSVREVTLGPETNNDIVVESGLKPGETVIVEGLQKVRPGMTVRPVPTGSPDPDRDPDPDPVPGQG
jgi:membrane fusion protein (multidrug efflux system)